MRRASYRDAVYMVRTDRTDLLCVVCGRFTGTVSARQRFALVAPGGTVVSAEAGAHLGCAKGLRQRRAPAPRPEPVQP